MKNILVIGDAMIDRYCSGSILRISPEAPVPVVSVEREEARDGAAANVVRNIAAMGGIVYNLYSRSFSFSPIVKLRIIAKGQQVVRVDFDKPQTPVTVDEAVAAANGCDIVVLSDYGKGTLDNVAAIIWALTRQGKQVLVDPKGRRFKQYEGATVLKPNIAELALLVGGWGSEDELEHKVKALQRMARIEAVLLTRGAGGMTLFSGSVTHIPAEAQQVVDVCGAGDTAMAAFATALAVRECTLLEAAKFASKAAGIAVQRFGTAVVKREELFP